MILPFVAMVMIGGGGRWTDGGGTGVRSSGRKVMPVRKLRLQLVAAALLAVVAGMGRTEAANPLGTPPTGGGRAATVAATSSGEMGDAQQQKQQQQVHAKPSALGFVPGASATALERANDPTWQELKNKVMAGAGGSTLPYSNPPLVHVAVDERPLDPSQYMSDVPRVNALGSVPTRHTGEASTDPPRFNRPDWFEPKDLAGADDTGRHVDHQGERQERADSESRISTDRVVSRSESTSSEQKSGDEEVIVGASVLTRNDGAGGDGGGKAGDLLCKRRDGSLFIALHGINPFSQTLVFQASNPLCKSTMLKCADGRPADMQFYVEAIAGPILLGNLSSRKLSELVPFDYDDDDDDYDDDDDGSEDERMLEERPEYTLRKSHPACLAPAIQCSDVLVGSTSTGGEVGGLGDTLVVADSFDGNSGKGRGKGWIYDKYGGSSDTRDSNDRLVSRDDIVTSKGSKASKGISSHASYLGRLFSRSSSVSKQSKSGSKHGRDLVGEGESKGYATSSSDEGSVKGLTQEGSTHDSLGNALFVKTRDYPRKGRWKKVISDDRCQHNEVPLYRCPNDKVGMPYRDRSGFFLVEMTSCSSTSSGRKVDGRRLEGSFTLSSRGDSKASSSSKGAVGGLSSASLGLAKRKKRTEFIPSGYVGSMVSGSGLDMKVTRLPADHTACQKKAISVYKCQGDKRSTPFRDRKGRLMKHLDLTQGDLLCGGFFLSPKRCCPCARTCLKFPLLHSYAWH